MKEAISLRFEEPDVDEDWEEMEPEEFWDPKTLAAWESARNAVLAAERELGGVALAFGHNSMATYTASKALDELGLAVGMLREVPQDPRWMADGYSLHAQLEWHSFTRFARRHMRWPSLQLPDFLMSRAIRKHQAWMAAENKKHRFETPEGSFAYQ